jgi:hypothetical protein
MPDVLRRLEGLSHVVGLATHGRLRFGEGGGVAEGLNGDPSVALGELRDLL